MTVGPMEAGPLRIEIRLQIDEALDRITRATADWPDERIERFQRKWQALELAGAEMVVVDWEEGQLVGRMADDFRRFLGEWGVDV